MYGTVEIASKAGVEEFSDFIAVNPDVPETVFVTDFKRTEGKEDRSFFVIDDLAQRREELQLRLMLDLDQTEKRMAATSRFTVADWVFCDERLFDD